MATNYEIAMSVFQQVVKDQRSVGAYDPEMTWREALKKALESTMTPLGSAPTYLCAKCGCLLTADTVGAFFNKTNYSPRCEEGGTHHAKPYDEERLVQALEPCPYDFAHTRDWCGHVECRRS